MIPPRLTLCSTGPVNGCVRAEVPHGIPHLGRVHLTAPLHYQQLLGRVGVLAGAGRPLTLHRRLWWATAQGHWHCPDWGRACASLDVWPTAS